MSAPDPDINILVFAQFLTELRRQGFRIGVGHYLRLQELLNKAGPETTPKNIKTLLCPIFATNQAEQELFYRAFDNFFSLFLPSTPRPWTMESADEAFLFQTLSPPKPDTRRKRLYYLGAALFLITAVIVTFTILLPEQARQVVGSGPLQENPAEKVNQIFGTAQSRTLSGGRG